MLSKFGILMTLSFRKLGQINSRLPIGPPIRRVWLTKLPAAFTSLSPDNHLRVQRQRDMASVIHDRNSPTPFSDDKPILAINYLNKYLGGAFWRPDDSNLIILADIQCVNPIDMLDLGIVHSHKQSHFSEITNVTGNHSRPLTLG